MNKIKITTDLIKSLLPADDRIERYLEHYESQEFSLDQFSRLKEISGLDRIWVLCRLLNQDQVIVFCLDAALRCLKLSANTSGYRVAEAAGSVFAATVPSGFDPTAISYSDFAIFAANAAANVAGSKAALADNNIAYAYAVGDKESIQVLVYLLEGET